MKDLKVFAKTFEDEARNQVEALASYEPYRNSKIRIMPDCLTEDTEILTDKGFVKIINLQMCDKIANYSEKTKMVYFSCPKNIIIREKGPKEKIYRFYNEQNKIDIRVSENHRMAIRNKMGISAKEVDNLKIKDLVLCASGNSCGLTNKYTDDLIRLVSWVVGDGSIKKTENKKSINYRIRFGLKKERKIERIKELLDRNNYIYHISISGKQTDIVLNTESSKPLLSIVGINKSYPSDFILLNNEQSLVFLEEAIMVDGDYEAYMKNRGFRLNTKKEYEANLFASIISINFGFSRIIKRTTNGFNGASLMYYVTAIKRENLIKSKSGIPNRRILKEEIQYNGKLVCVECDSTFFVAKQKSNIFITGNCHAGKGCTIGTTMTIDKAVTPNLVGVDIGCGMLTIEISKPNLDLEYLDFVINNYVPSRFNIHDEVPPSFYTDYIEWQLSLMKCFKHIDLDRALRSIGTLGGGNHFIEVDHSDKTGKNYLVIHSGSRNLGVRVCNYYQEKAYKSLQKSSNNVSEIINKLKLDGREKDISSVLKKIKKHNVNKDLAHLTGQDMEDYLYDMDIVQEYARFNRECIADIILEYMNWNKDKRFHTVHNYIDIKNMILRKGAVSAELGETLLIPMNMRDGSLLCIGKGNEDWNFSAPHGAGRLMSRTKAKHNISMNDFKDSMKDVFTTSVCYDTLDEAPNAYKNMNEIISAIEPTVYILDTIKPIYNYKSH